MRLWLAIFKSTWCYDTKMGIAMASSLISRMRFHHYYWYLMIFFPIQTWKNRVGGIDARSKSANDVVMILKSFFFAYQQLQLLESFQIVRPKPWSLKFLYRNAPIRGLALSKQNICEISHKKMCDSSIMIKKASNYTMKALNKSSELWHSSSGRDHV